MSGNVGSIAGGVTATGSGNNRYATVNGAAKRYEGFHLNRYDTNVTINTEGTAVLNVYYDRNLVTLTFLYRDRGWQTQATMTGLYGQTLSQNGYTWPTNRWWYDGYGWLIVYYGTGTRTTILDAFILSDGGSEQTFYGFDGNGSNTVHFLKKNSNGTYTEANTATVTDGTFYISDKYNGYKAVSYSTNNSTWTALGEKDSEGYYGSVSDYTNLYIRYDPLLYNIIYMDGIYVTGNNIPVEGYESRGELNEVEGIPYGSSLTPYNSGGDDYYAPTYAGFTFAGWYIDDACTHPYTFSSMSEGITVYAKWVQNQYRVFLHSNATGDTTLTWGTEGQDMNFRVSSGGSVSLPTGRRAEYTFIGWYTDTGLKTVYPSATVLNDSLSYLTPYDKTVTMTDEMDKYGNIVNPATATNADVNRPWITKKLDLYAKWSAILTGADGIGIVYDANGGTNAPTDTTLYKDNVEAVAQSASTAPAGKQFEKWMVQTWNKSTNQYDDTNVYVYPGATFTVLKDNAEMVIVTSHEEGGVVVIDKATYTVRLKAVYVDAEAPTPTHITWYANGGTLNSALADSENYDVYSGTTTTSYIDLQINQKVPAAPANTFTRTGYKFIGWARSAEPTGAFDRTAKTVNESLYTVNDGVTLWLKLNDDGITYTEVGTNNTSVTEIAADEDSPYHALYAVWERDHFYIYHSGAAGDGNLETVDVPLTGTYDLTQNLTPGTLYGGYYLDYAGKGTYADDGEKGTGGVIYIGMNYDWTDPVTTEPGTAMTPVAGETYYIKEVPTYYLRNYHQITYVKSSGTLTGLYLLSAIDDMSYRETGFILQSTDGRQALVIPSFTITNGATGKAVTLKANTVFKSLGITEEGEYLGYYDLTGMDYFAAGSTFTVLPYWVTADNVVITGISPRTIKITSLTRTGISKSDQ